MPLNAAHLALSNTMFSSKNWKDKETLTDDDIAAYAQEYIEELEMENKQWLEDQDVGKTEINRLRRDLKRVKEERDEAEDAIVEFVDELKRLEMRSDDIRRKRAAGRESGNRQQHVKARIRSLWEGAKDGGSRRRCLVVPVACSRWRRLISLDEIRQIRQILMLFVLYMSQ